MRYHEDNNLGPDPIRLSSEKYYSSMYYFFSWAWGIYQAESFRDRGDGVRLSIPRALRGAHWLGGGPESSWALRTEFYTPSSGEAPTGDTGISFTASVVVWPEKRERTLNWDRCVHWGKCWSKRSQPPRPAAGASAPTPPRAESQFLKIHGTA